MTLPIISADERLAEKRGVKGVLVGRAGIGKTSQLWTLPPESTLFFDLEAGDLAVEGWAGDTLRPRTWAECRDFAVFIGGPNPALRDDQPFSQAHFEAVCARFGDPAVLDRYETIFVDSITVAGRLCLQWCKGQPPAYSEKIGKPDSRGAYGLLGQEMIGWLVHLQHTRGKNVWFVGILDERLDDFNRRVFSLQIEGAKTGLELPGIVDEVITLGELKADDGSSYRAFVCQTLNPWSYPAKDRSGRLDLIEEPHLGRLMAKISGPARPAPERRCCSLILILVMLNYSFLTLVRATRPSRNHRHRGVPRMSTWTDYNDADEQSSFDLIPKGTLVKVRMTIRPGGYDDPSQGWTGGYATRNDRTGSVYLNCEFVVLEGDYARRKLWSLIGLHGPKGPEWARMGRAFIRACLNSARGIHPKDESPQAQNARRIGGFKDLDGLEFLGKVDWEKDQNANDKHVVKTAIGADHKDYAALMGAGHPVAAATPQAGAPAPSRGPVPTRPSWAQ